mmetsp:Transcript_30965/g.77452  ORF Transcript_30965/g.77452 Transcript_30965/m.77452 type:complete len:254 (-) Transcript_30965:556-1317(-)
MEAYIEAALLRLDASVMALSSVCARSRSSAKSSSPCFAQKSRAGLASKPASTISRYSRSSAAMRASSASDRGMSTPTPSSSTVSSSSSKLAARPLPSERACSCDESATAAAMSRNASSREPSREWRAARFKSATSSRRLSTSIVRACASSASGCFDSCVCELAPSPTEAPSTEPAADSAAGAASLALAGMPSLASSSSPSSPSCMMLGRLLSRLLTRGRASVPTPSGPVGAAAAPLAFWLCPGGLTDPAQEGE